MAESKKVLKADREVGSETGYEDLFRTLLKLVGQAGPTGVPSG